MRGGVGVATVLVGAVDVGGVEADLGGGVEVGGVGGDHEALLGGEVHDLGGAAIDVGVGLVLAGGLGAEDDVPGQAAVLGHVDHEGDVAVGEGGEDEAGLEAGESGDAVRPGVEAVPGVVEVVDLGFGEALQAEFGEGVDEALAVEDVERDPVAGAVADGGHGGTVAAAPGVGEGCPIDLGPVDLGPVGLGVGGELPALAGDGGAPVDDGAEDVEGEHADVGDGGVGHGWCFPVLGPLWCSGPMRGTLAGRLARVARGGTGNGV